MTDLATLSAVEQAQMIRDRRASPMEVTRAVLDRIAAWEPRINAFVTLDAEGALNAARAAEVMVMAGVPLGPLHGVPTVTIGICRRSRACPLGVDRA